VAQGYGAGEIIMQIETCEDLNILSHLEYELGDTEAVVPCYFQDGAAATYVGTMVTACEHDGLKTPVCTSCFERAQKKFNGSAIYCAPCDDMGVITPIIKMEWRRL
jgi:hypothetical protein